MENESRNQEGADHEMKNDECGGTCTVTYAKLDTMKGARLLRPRRILYKAKTFEPVGDSTAESLPSVPIKLKRVVRKMKRRKMTLDMSECQKGCFCDKLELESTIIERRVITVGDLLETGYVSGSILPDPSDPHGQDRRVRAGETTLLRDKENPLQLDFEIDIIGSSTNECCGYWDGYNVYDIRRRYVYRVDVDAEWRIETWSGECAPNRRLLE